VPVTQIVLAAACAQAAALPDSQFVAVNVSSRHFAQGDLLADVRNALARSALPPAQLHIEVTESAIMQEPEAALRMIEAVRALGCQVILDDFGTGYSSLSYLHRFPIDALKIDASFVRAAPRTPKNVEIIRSILALGRGLGIGVIAEGIETDEEDALMRALDCQFGQGFLFGRPGTVSS
jgi:EAL domain-containing protein (putative c-di-GMP-specific phosphodiesterase class I)